MTINKLVLPDSINTIKDYAFKNTSNLSKVVVGGGVNTTIASAITALTNKKITLGKNIFNGISKIHTAHSFTYTITKAATCTAKGSKTGTCDCGNTDIQTIAATGHSYGSWVTTKAATCTVSGSKKKTCSKCGDIVTETIAATGHNYGDWVTTAATCISDGNRKKTCSKCKDVVTEITDTATGHTYGDWVTTKEATCTAKGSKKKTCSKCGDVVTEAIAATGHKYSSWVTTKAATCTASGSRKKTCSKCGKVVTETISATGHSYGDWVTTAATCTTDGNRKKTCSKCKDVVTEITELATGHSYGSWVITKAATCTASGSKKKTCSKCGDIVTETIAATGHSYGSWVVSSDGSTKTRTCSKCGNKETVSNTVDLKNASTDVKTKYNFIGTTDTVNSGQVQIGTTPSMGTTSVPVYGYYTELGSTGTSRFDSSNNTCKECIIYLSKAVTLCGVTYKVGYYKLGKLDPNWWVRTSGNSKNFLHIWSGLDGSGGTASNPQYTYLGSTYSVVNAV